MVSADGLDENACRQRCVKCRFGVHSEKMLRGIEKVIATPDQPVHTRSLMITELKQESVTLQQRGLWPCATGLRPFIPHKDMKDLGRPWNRCPCFVHARLRELI
jgi:hypothetical protein